MSSKPHPAPDAAHTGRHVRLNVRLALLTLAALAAPAWIVVQEFAGPAPAPRALVLAGCALLAMFIFIGTAALHRGLARELGSVRDGISKTAGGDLANLDERQGSDDFARIHQGLDAMCARLSCMVADIRNTSSLVAHAGRELADNTQSLSNRTENQAASLEQITASVAQLSSTVANSEQSARAVDEQASKVRDIAESGGNAMKQAVESMDSIQASSLRIRDIVAVIDGIAFQTNILALNAAVEAARAGEQGRGFAVVAAEVRVLAQRSAASAREIKALIEESVDRVNAGAAQISSASGTLDSILDGIREVAAKIGAICASTHEQSGGLGQISSAMSQLDELTRQNARMVEQAFASSERLGARAAKLSDTVAGFRLRQGTTDEAQSLVTQAVQRFRRDGPRALDEITADGASYADRDMYVFALDRAGTYLAFAGRPDKVGTLIQSVPGVDGARLMHDVHERMQQGAGWIDYEIINPATGQVAYKTSYVEPVADDLVLACGVYREKDLAEV